jgi:hypothetical protein
VSITHRARSIAGTALKVQRRIVLTQALFWPVVIGTGLVAGTAFFVTRRQTQQPVPPAPVATA